MWSHPFKIDVSDVDWVGTGGPPTRPTLTVQVKDQPDPVSEPSTTMARPQLGDQVDVTFRLQEPPTRPDAPGVLAVTNRVTGEFILEVPTNAAPINDLIAAAKRYAVDTDHDATYRLVLRADSSGVIDGAMRLLLVYRPDGTLLRRYSLIPAGIEL